jgi:hypothetical protein
LVIEDYDWTGLGFDGDDPQLERARKAIITFMERAGFDPRYGRRLVDDRAAAGLTDVRGEGLNLWIFINEPEISPVPEGRRA